MPTAGMPTARGHASCLLVLSGTVELVVGDSEDRLKPGDSASFDGAVAHTYRNASAGRPARFSLVVYEPALAVEQP